MTQTDQATTGKAAATAAAKKMLGQRIALVTTLGDAIGDAIDNHRRAGDAVTAAKTAQETAAETARSAHTDAIAGGWTTTELRHSGLVVPAAPRRRRAETTAAGDTTAGDKDAGE